MIIETFPSGPFATNAYVAACSETKVAAIIDAPQHSLKKISAFVDQHQLHPVALLLTHSHWDHIADAAAIKKQFDIPIYIHNQDAPNLRKPGSDKLPCWISIQGMEADRLISEGDLISIGNLNFRVIHTPGHTPGGVCFYCPEEHLLFSGDTLFKGTIGNLSFPTCSAEAMWTSLEKLAKLPAKTQVFPGHGPQTTIGLEHWLPNAKQIFGQS